MSDAEHTRLLAGLRRQGLDERALIDALLDTCPATLSLAERRGFLLRTAQAVLDRLLLTACESERCCGCGHPIEWHASFAPRPTDDGSVVLGRCSPPANVMRLTKAGGLVVERVRAAAAAGSGGWGGCACRVFTTAGQTRRATPEPTLCSRCAKHPDDVGTLTDRAGSPLCTACATRHDDRMCNVPGCVGTAIRQDVVCTLHESEPVFVARACPSCGGAEPHRVGVAATGSWAGHAAFICPSCDHRWRERVAPA